VLDRLLWFDSVGYRHFRPTWWSVTDGEHSAVVPVPAGIGAVPETEGEVDLRQGNLPAEWARAAEAALRAEDAPA
jgi:hypothetical protein